MRKLIIQQSLSTFPYEKYNYPQTLLRLNHEMMRLTYQRHSAYASAHMFDFWRIEGSMYPEMAGGGWEKIALIKKALELDYDFVAWIDADAAVMDFEVDLIDAIPEGKSFGTALHDAPWFKGLDILPHYNVGVTYWRNTELSRKFTAEWFAAYPGSKRWMEQGAFNELIDKDEYKDGFHTVDARFNATVNVNLVDNPVVKGWHGIMPMEKRYGMMKAEMREDFLKFNT